MVAAPFRSDEDKNTVKDGLTASTSKTVENSAYAEFVIRIVRAFGRRIAAGDIEALKDLVALSTIIDGAAREAVAGLRQAGFSWAEIADRLGVTKQAAQQRWGGDGK